jgi:phage host-nuclease inhibitor protein Gam
MNTNEMLENLTELYAQRDLLSIDRRRAETDAMPQEVINRLSDIAAEFDPKAEAVTEKIAALEAAVKEAVIADEKTAKGGSLQAVFAKGRVTWDSKQLDGLMIAVPQLAQARKVGAPSVSIRKV